MLVLATMFTSPGPGGASKVFLQALNVTASKRLASSTGIDLTVLFIFSILKS